MNARGAKLTRVHVLEEPGLFEVTSSSPTTYYVDTRDPGAPRSMRWRGAGLSLSSPMDNRWSDLILLTASPDAEPGAQADVTLWTLNVGWCHTYCTTREVDHPNGPIHWVSGRVCGAIRRLDALPAESARPRPDAWLPAGSLIALAAVATPYQGGWAVFVPDLPGLHAQVATLEEADSSLAERAAILTGRPPAAFIVSVQYVPPPPSVGSS